MTYNEIIQKAGKKIKKHVYYINNGVTTNVNDENVERIKFDTQTPLVGTSINGCEITLKEPINGEIYVQIDATYGNETKSETFGPYNLKEKPTYDANKKTYLHKCYDNLLKSMVDYQPITMAYPCTVYQFFTRLCIEIGYTNNILSLPNGSRQIASDIYNNIGFTYRDVLDDIAYANGVLFYIDDNEIKIATLGGDTITIDDDILKNKNIDFGKHYGPINSIVLSRSNETDNVYLKDEQSVAQNGLCEFKIVDNQLMNDNNRSDYLPALLNQLNGIQYDIYDTELTGYGKLRPLQTVNFATGNNTYSSYIFNNEITLTTGYKQAIYNEQPKQTETDYKVADETDKKLVQANIMVNKQLGQINIEVSKKLDSDDFTKAEIVALINDNNVSQVKISADVLNLLANDILNILAGNTINLTSKNIVIDSNNFKVTANGDLTANSGTFGGTVKGGSVESLNYSSSSGMKIDLSNGYIYGHIKFDGGNNGFLTEILPKQLKTTELLVVNELGGNDVEISSGDVICNYLNAQNIDCGTCTLNSSTLVSVYFNKTFPSIPKIVLTAHTTKAGVITAKVRDVNWTYFTAIIGGSVSGDVDFDWIAIG